MQSFDAYEAAGWDQRATAYADFLGPVTARVAEPLLNAAHVGAGTRVVDVGSGPGQITAACAARGARAVGVDVAPGMVAHARASHPGLEFRLGGAYRLPVPDGSQDAVVGNFVVLHLGEPERALADVVRVLRPGGRLALSTWDAPGQARIVGVFADAVTAVGAGPPPGMPDGPPFFRYADAGLFAELLAGAGLTGVGVDTVRFTHRFAGPDALWDGLTGAAVRTGALILGQPAAIQARIRAAYDEAVAAYRTPDGALDLPVSVRLAYGQKEPA
jgi:SAM-dependent methyltransferase